MFFLIIRIFMIFLTNQNFSQNSNNYYKKAKTLSNFFKNINKKFQIYTFYLQRNSIQNVSGSTQLLPTFTVRYGQMDQSTEEHALNLGSL